MAPGECALTEAATIYCIHKGHLAFASTYLFPQAAAWEFTKLEICKAYQVIKDRKGVEQRITFTHLLDILNSEALPNQHHSQLPKQSLYNYNNLYFFHSYAIPKKLWSHITSNFVRLVIWLRYEKLPTSLQTAEQLFKNTFRLHRKQLELFPIISLFPCHAKTSMVT